MIFHRKNAVKAVYFTEGNKFLPRISIFLQIYIIFDAENLLIFYEKKRNKKLRALKGPKDLIQIISTLLPRFTWCLISTVYRRNMNVMEIRGE